MVFSLVVRFDHELLLLTIDHELLLLKLVKYGFCNKAVTLIRNYLEDRFSIVNFDGKASKKEQLNSGVPQGSILGPLLFIIFINDLCYLQTSSSKSLFADDSTLFLAGTNFHSIAESLELDLALVSEWLEHNRLLLNVKKSNAMIFKWKYQQQFDIMNTNLDAQNNVEIKCNNQLIPFVKKFTLLGVTLDEFLTFDVHTISLCSKVNWKISILKKSSFLFDLKFRTTLFKLFIMSKYDYCSSLFFHFGDNINQNRLEKNYCKALKSYLNINIKGMPIDEQFNKLKSFKVR